MVELTHTSHFAMAKTMLEPFQCLPYDPRQLEAAVTAHNPSEFVEALIDQGLAPLWSDFIDTEVPNLRINEQIRRGLRQQRMASAAMYMLQTRSAARVCRCLADARIPCAIFKGIVLRERLFSKPDARPADDIDVLIPAEQRNAALTALVNVGYRFRGKATTISHEAVLQDGPVAVDLHWHLFRPGRSRIELAPTLMQKTRTDGLFTGLDDAASLLVMLVHPAFTKHVNHRLSKLVRVVELDRMLRRTEPDWDWILETIDVAGVRTAAWSVLHWVRTLMDTPVPTSVLNRLAPGPLQERYLTAWIERGLPDRCSAVPGLVQFAFTLALHDRFGDAARAIAYLGRSRLEAKRTLADLNRLRNSTSLPDQ